MSGQLISLTNPIHRIPGHFVNKPQILFCDRALSSHKFICLILIIKHFLLCYHERIERACLSIHTKGKICLFLTASSAREIIWNIEYEICVQFLESNCVDLSLS